MTDRLRDRLPLLDSPVVRSGLRVVSFSIAACLFVGTSVLLLFGVLTVARETTGSAGASSVVAIVVFAGSIGLLTYLLVVLDRRGGSAATSDDG